MKKRGLVIGLLIMLAVITSGFTYAFWANGVNNATQNGVTGSITIGQGESIATTIDVTNQIGSKVLVPSGRVVDSETQTASVVLSFNVKWEELVQNSANLTGVLSVTQVSKTINGSTDNAGLVNVVINVPESGAITVNGATVVVTVTVTLTEPATQQIYNDIKNGTILITLNFGVVAN